MQKQHRTIRVSDELWEQIKEHSSQEQMSISEWIRVVFVRAVECSKLENLGDKNQNTKLEQIHKTIDMIWGSTQHQIENDGRLISYDLLKKAVDQKHS